MKALKESSATVPQDLQELAEVFASKKKQGLVQGHGSGYGGSGFKFDKAEDAKIKQARKSKAKVGMDPVCSFFLGQSVQHSTHRMFHKPSHFWGQKSLTGIWHTAGSELSGGLWGKLGLKADNMPSLPITDDWPNPSDVRVHTSLTSMPRACALCTHT